MNASLILHYDNKYTSKAGRLPFKCKDEQLFNSLECSNANNVRFIQYQEHLNVNAESNNTKCDENLKMNNLIPSDSVQYLQKTNVFIVFSYLNSNLALIVH